MKSALVIMKNFQSRAAAIVVSSIWSLCIGKDDGHYERTRREESTWQQPDYVVEQGWATMPGTKEPNEEVAEACVDKLLELADS